MASRAEHHRDLIREVYYPAMRKGDVKPIREVTDEVAGQVGALRRQGIPDEQIALGLEAMVEAGSWPHTLAKHSIEAKRRLLRAPLQEFLAAHKGKWPTGGSFVRGSHSGSIQPDPLGYDDVPADAPFGPPTKSELEQALAERSTGSVAAISGAVTQRVAA